MKKLLIISFLTMFLGAVLSVLVSMSIQSKETGGLVEIKAAEEYEQYEIEKKELPEEVEWITNSFFPSVSLMSIRLSPFVSSCNSRFSNVSSTTSSNAPKVLTIIL